MNIQVNPRRQPLPTPFTARDTRSTVHDVVCLGLRGTGSLSAACLTMSAVGFCLAPLALESLGSTSEMLALAATMLPSAGAALLALKGAGQLSDEAGSRGRQAMGLGGELLGRTAALACILSACAAVTLALS
ncbi:MAG: hypothetical protein AMXMBFR33_69720 [Candidatus Xenobia bacterium]